MVLHESVGKEDNLSVLKVVRSSQYYLQGGASEQLWKSSRDISFLIIDLESDFRSIAESFH